MKRVRAFGRFGYEFVVGEDWRVAAAVVAALAITAILATATTVPAWWVLPAAVVLILSVSLWRAARSARRPPQT